MEAFVGSLISIGLAIQKYVADVANCITLNVFPTFAALLLLLLAYLSFSVFEVMQL